MSTIAYTISAHEYNDHLFDVELTFNCQANQNYTLSLPAWLPGSYMIRDFAKNIIQLSAHSQNKAPLTIHKLDKQTWQITATDGQISVNYQVFAFDLSVRTAYLDNQRGFFNGSSTFLAVQELQHHSCQLIIKPIADKPHWQVATGLRRTSYTRKYHFGEYLATDYQELIDCPVAIGELDLIEFTVEGVPHHLVFTSRHYGDRNRMAADISKLCQHHINLFGEAPFNEYWFITHLLEEGFGGLEHKNSTILQASRFDLPNPNQPDSTSDNYQTFLSLCSHEYFHAWNICRIKPKEFVPYNLQEEVYTEQLWAYEGITSYYDDFSLYRTGLISFEQYLKILSKTATRVHRGQGELKQTVCESSYYAWTKFYQQGPDAVNNIVSYYTKGALIALWLDLTIRSKSKQTYSLDNLMRELWIHFGRTGQGTQEDDFINICNILCQEDISDSFKQLLHSAERVDLAPLLKQVGIDYQASKFSQLNELTLTDTNDYQAYLGAHYKDHSLGVKITNVLQNSPAAKAGLAVNDILIAIDNTKISKKSLQQLGHYLPENSSFSCHYFRDDLLVISEIAFIDSPLSGVNLTVKNKRKLPLWQKIID